MQDLTPFSKICRMYVQRTPEEHFRGPKDSNVLIYWPHGFGDWVFLSYILPFFEKSNRYFVTRFGDDNTSLLDRCPGVNPAYMGFNSVHNDDGGKYGMRHFEVSEAGDSTQLEPVRLPLALAEVCRHFDIDTMVYIPFMEVFGGAKFPFHTKARSMIRHLMGAQCVNDPEMQRPLPCMLTFQVSRTVTRWVECRLRTWAGVGKHKLCLIGRGGYTSVGKNWGHLWRDEMPTGKQREGEECRDFMRLLSRKDSDWIFLSIEDRIFSGDDTLRDRSLPCFSFAELFGTAEFSAIPFGTLMMALLNLADLMVGVPAGPYHLAMAKRDFPVIGLWTEHFPSWYDEPKEASLHIMSNNHSIAATDRRAGSFSRQGELNYEMMHVPTRIITGEHVVAGVEQLLGI